MRGRTLLRSLKVLRETIRKRRDPLRNTRGTIRKRRDPLRGPMVPKEGKWR